MIGMEENKYINDKISKWTTEINNLAGIATTHPQASYTAYVTSYQHKLPYQLRTIPNIEDQLEKINEVVWHKLIPSVIGGHIINNAETVMLSLPTHLGGLGFKIFTETEENEHKDSTRITSNLQAKIFGTNTIRARLEVKSKLNMKKEIRKSYQQFLTLSDEKTIKW